MKPATRVSMIAIITSMPGQESIVGEALAEIVPKMDGEPGVLVYSLSRQADDPAKYVFFEIFEDQGALDYHRISPAMEVLQSKLKGRVVGGGPQVIWLQPVKSKGLP